jgi:putative two-component system response regulator
MSNLSTGMRAIFQNNKDDFQQRVQTLEEAVAAILAGSLDEDLRASAERDAHKLAGSLGTFGLPRGSELAGELERRFAPRHLSVVDEGVHLAECVRALRAELDSGMAAVGTIERDDLQVDEGDQLSTMIRSETGRAGAALLPPAAGRILVVDDDMAVRRALSSILSEAGYDVGDVGSAREARHALEHDSIALLLSDVSMPGETGLDLIRFALCEHPETATLMISALEDPGIAQVAMEFGAYGYLSKPVRRSAVLIGVMNALRRRDMEIRERAERENLERIVRLRTSALSQALERLEGAAKQSRVLQAQTIHRWAHAAEYRDPGIGRHLERMSRYCAMMGRIFRLHPDSLELASLLHDVGKLAIPDNILLKPGLLTPDERLVIETHADIGYGMLRGSGRSVLDLAALIAWTHHEKFDGSGYPRGLSGSNIPLEGRIAAVADVFDAMTSDRIYRPAWSVDATIAWMKHERGKHFDPDVFDGFVASMDEILAIQSARTSG